VRRALLGVRFHLRRPKTNHEKYNTMIIPELNEALANLNTKKDYERRRIFHTIYHIIYRKGMACFDDEGKTESGMEGDALIRMLIAHYESTGKDCRAWWMRRYLKLYLERFRGRDTSGTVPETAEFFYLPAPKNRSELE
jgi:hypothetical protein